MGVSFGACLKNSTSPAFTRSAKAIHIGEAVEFAFWLGFGGLDEHGAVDDEREVGREGVIAFVEQRFGHVDGFDAFRLDA